jgi:hypothetical protein
MIGAALQIILLSVTRWDVALPIVSSATVALLAITATLGGRSRQSAAVRPPTPDALPPAATV